MMSVQPPTTYPPYVFRDDIVMLQDYVITFLLWTLIFAACFLVYHGAKFGIMFIMTMIFHLRHAIKLHKK